MKHILSLALIAFLAGCASEPKKIETPAGQPVATIWRLTFDKRLEQNDFAAPILNVDFGDETLPFLVSTASPFHTIDTWAAKATKFPITGDKLVSKFEIDDDKVPESSFTVSKMNSRFEENGVAGALSPQLLASEGQAIGLDFLNSKFYRGPFEKLAKDLDAKLVTAENGSVCGQSKLGGASLYLLTVKIDDVPMKLLVDSAAEDTTVMEGHPAAHKLTKSGKSNFSKLHKGKVHVGGKTITRMVDIQPLPNLPCAAEGVLGMDVLKLCTVVLDKQRIGLNCHND